MGIKGLNIISHTIRPSVSSVCINKPKNAATNYTAKSVPNIQNPPFQNRIYIRFYLFDRCHIYKCKYRAKVEISAKYCQSGTFGRLF